MCTQSMPESKGTLVEKKHFWAYENIFDHYFYLNTER